MVSIMASSGNDYMCEFSGQDDDDSNHRTNPGSIIGGHVGLIQIRTPKLEHYPSSSYGLRQDSAQCSESYDGQVVRALFRDTDRHTDFSDDDDEDNGVGIGIVRSKHNSFNHLEVIEEAAIVDETINTMDVQGNNAFAQEDQDMGSPLSWIWNSSIKATISEDSKATVNLHGMTRSNWRF